VPRATHGQCIHDQGCGKDPGPRRKLRMTAHGYQEVTTSKFTGEKLAVVHARCTVYLYPLAHGGRPLSHLTAPSGPQCRSSSDHRFHRLCNLSASILFIRPWSGSEIGIGMGLGPRHKRPGQVLGAGAGAMYEYTYDARYFVVYFVIVAQSHPSDA
jgi:hypothetical protein